MHPKRFIFTTSQQSCGYKLSSHHKRRHTAQHWLVIAAQDPRIRKTVINHQNKLCGYITPADFGSFDKTAESSQLSYSRIWLDCDQTVPSASFQFLTQVTSSCTCHIVFLCRFTTLYIHNSLTLTSGLKLTCVTNPFHHGLSLPQNCIHGLFTRTASSEQIGFCF